MLTPGGGRAALPAEKIRNHFDTDALFQPPGFFDFVVLGAPGAAQWKVLTGKSALASELCGTDPSPIVPRSRSRPPCAATWISRWGLVGMMMLRGQGRGGIVFRMADEQNFPGAALSTSGSGERAFFPTGREFPPSWEAPRESSTGSGAFSRSSRRAPISSRASTKGRSSRRSIRARPRGARALRPRGRVWRRSTSSSRTRQSSQSLLPEVRGESEPPVLNFQDHG